MRQVEAANRELDHTKQKIAQDRAAAADQVEQVKELRKQRNSALKRERQLIEDLNNKKGAQAKERSAFENQSARSLEQEEELHDKRDARRKAEADVAMWRRAKLSQRRRQNMGGLEYSEHTRLAACLLTRLRGASS